MCLLFECVVFGVTVTIHTVRSRAFVVIVVIPVEGSRSRGSGRVGAYVAFRVSDTHAHA